MCSGHRLRSGEGLQEGPQVRRLRSGSAQQRRSPVDEHLDTGDVPAEVGGEEDADIRHLARVAPALVNSRVPFGSSTSMPILSVLRCSVLSSIFVSMNPGQTALQRIPSRPSSSATTFMNATWAALELAYALVPGLEKVRVPLTLLVTMMLAPSLRLRCGTAKWTVRKVPLRLVCIVWSHSSGCSLHRRQDAVDPGVGEDDVQ